MSSKSFTYTFPSVRGIQAGREFFVSQVPLRMLPRMFVFTDVDLPVEMRTQRTLNDKRIPGMARYVNENRSDYTFSAITASIDADVSFEPIGPEDDQVATFSLSFNSGMFPLIHRHFRAESSRISQGERGNENGRE